MFHLVNPFGNVHKMVRTEKKKNELLKDGWKLVEEPEQDAEPTKSGKKNKKTEKE